MEPSKLLSDRCSALSCECSWRRPRVAAWRTLRGWLQRRPLPVTGDVGCERIAARRLHRGWRRVPHTAHPHCAVVRLVRSFVGAARASRMTAPSTSNRLRMCSKHVLAGSVVLSSWLSAEPQSLPSNSPFQFAQARRRRGFVEGWRPSSNPTHGFASSTWPPWSQSTKVQHSLLDVYQSTCSELHDIHNVATKATADVFQTMRSRARHMCGAAAAQGGQASRT